ncbi:MAG: single-stranded DNA-binding protein [Lachnospiraceae bacterium]|nr:single-stranded DNA-binding protein [Lachnospiraceae bacterium]
MNKVQLTGRLTADPEIKVYNNENGDVYVARYSLAVPRRFKKDEADFFRCVSFGKTAQFLEKYMNKGSRIVAAGNIRQDRWKDKDGKDRSAVVVVIDEVEFAQSKLSENDTPDDGFLNIPGGIDESVPFGDDEEIVTERIKSFMDNNDY